MWVPFNPYDIKDYFLIDTKGSNFAQVENTIMSKSFFLIMQNNMQ
jgi:hypothetical protein